MSEEARAAGGEPIWDVVARYLRAQKTITPRALNVPNVDGVAGNPGHAPSERSHQRAAPGAQRA